MYGGGSPRYTHVRSGAAYADRLGTRISDKGDLCALFVCTGTGHAPEPEYEEETQYEKSRNRHGQ